MKLRVSQNSTFELEVKFSSKSVMSYVLGCRGEEGRREEEEGEEEGS